MPSEQYMEIYHNYWPKASQKIYGFLMDNISLEDKIYEVGVGSGHLLFNLLENGYKASGCEIRKEQYEKTYKKLKAAGFNHSIFCEDVMVVTDKVDVVYSTGLLQCFCGEKRIQIIQKIASLADRALIVVPEIVEDRNVGDLELVGVAGCAEYCTKGLEYELRKSFDCVQMGKWYSEELELEDDFCFYVCRHME